MFQRAIHDHNLDIDRSFYIGDNQTDYIAGETSNISSYIYQFHRNISSENKVLQSMKEFQNQKKYLHF